MNWLRAWIERWLGIDDLREKNRKLEEQVRGLGNVLKQIGDDYEQVSGRVNNILTQVNTSIQQGEDRILMRLADVEERLTTHDYTKTEADAPSGGYVPWSERKRRAELAAADPTKWTKKTVAQEK